MAARLGLAAVTLVVSLLTGLLFFYGGGVFLGPGGDIDRAVGLGVLTMAGLLAAAAIALTQRRAALAVVAALSAAAGAAASVWYLMSVISSD